MEERLTHRQQVFDRPQGLYQTTIDDLPDDVLLEIFDSYLDDKDPNDIYSADRWHTLAHMCQRWRSVVFASPRRLDIRLLCTGRRSVRSMLDIWPTLPIHIEYYHSWKRASEMVLKNIIAALEHPDRVRHISITNFPGTWEEALDVAMQVPFPELTSLQLWSCGTPVSVLPGGPTPRLKTLQLEGVPIPAVRNLLLSAGDLVDLTLSRIPLSDYFSPESMVACLSPLKRLESLFVGIQLPLSRLDQPSSPHARTVLPALTKFSFEGVSRYLEDFVARIDTPVLSQLYTTYDGDVIFDIPHLRQFIGRARRLKPSKAARVTSGPRFILLEFPPGGSTLRIVLPRMDWQIASMASICGQLSPFFSLAERLDLVKTYSLTKPRRINNTIPTHLLEFLLPFTAIQSLYVSKSLVPYIAPALRELIGERATEVLPNLRDLFLGGSVIPRSVHKMMQPFFDARRLSSQPIAIHRWEGEGADL